MLCFSVIVNPILHKRGGGGGLGVAKTIPQEIKLHLAKSLPTRIHSVVHISSKFNDLLKFINLLKGAILTCEMTFLRQVQIRIRKRFVT